MTLASIICTRKDIEKLLQTLSSFGEFHIEEATEKENTTDYGKNIQKAEQSLTDIEQMSKQLIVKKGNLLDIFKAEVPTKVDVSAENWEALSDSTSQQVQSLKETIDDLNNALSNLNEKDEALNHTKSILTILKRTNTDLSAIEDMQVIHITIASLPHRNLEALRIALKPYPTILQSRTLDKNEDFISLAVPNKVYGEIERILKIHHAAIFEIPQYLPRNVEAALKAEPGIQPEDPLVFGHGFFHRLAFVNRAAHRLFAPDILAGLRGSDRDQRMPVRRRGDMDDVDVFAFQHFAEVLVALHVRPRQLKAVLQVLLVHVADGEQFGGGINGLEMPLAHAADADDGFGERLIGRSVARAAQDMARHKADNSDSSDGTLEELPTGQRQIFLHAQG